MLLFNRGSGRSFPALFFFVTALLLLTWTLLLLDPEKTSSSLPFLDLSLPFSPPPLLPPNRTTLVVPSSSPINSTLHLLIPLSSFPPPSLGRPESVPAYCKTILTSLIQGFEPVIVDLGEQGTWEEGMSKKIAAVGEYVHKLELEKEEEAEDVVFMIDGWDVWMQSGPEVLMREYASPAQALRESRSGS